MGQGTVTLPSGDKLVTQIVTLPGGAQVHREEMVIAGTINAQIAAVVNSTPGSSDYGLTVRPIQVINDIVHAMNAALNNIAAIGGQLDDTGTTAATEGNVAAVRITAQRAAHVNLRNDGGTEIGTSGAPVRIDPTGSTIQPVSIPGTPSVRIDSMPAVNVSAGSVAYITNPAVSIVGTVAVSSLPSITFSGQQPIHGTVVVSSMPAVQVSAGSVAYITNPAVSIVGTVNVSSLPPITFSGQQPIHGTVQVGNTVSTTVTNTPAITFSGQQPIHGTVAVYGTPSVAISTMPAIQVSSGTMMYVTNPAVPIVGTVNVSSLPPITFSGQQPIHGTVQVTNTVNTAVTNTPAITFSGQQPIHGTVVVSEMPAVQVSAGSVAYITNPAVSIVGTVNVSSLPPITFSGQQPIHGTVQVSNTVNTNVTNTPAITFSGQQPIHGTVVISEMPAVQVSAGSVAYITNPAVSIVGTVNVSSLPPITFSGQQPIHGTVAIHGVPSVTLSGVSTVTANQGTPAGNNNAWPITWSGAPSVAISGVPSVTFSGQQPIHGTVVVSSVPPITFASAQSVVVQNSAFAGTPVATLAEQVSQTSQLSTINTSVISARDELRGTLTVKFPSAQSVNIANTPAITFSGQQPIHGTIQVTNTVNVAVTNTPAITFSGQQPIHGTVVVSEMPAVQVSAGSVAYITNPAVPVVGTVLVSSLPPITFASPQPTSTVAGTVNVRIIDAQFVSLDDIESNTGNIDNTLNTVIVAEGGVSDAVMIGGGRFKNVVGPQADDTVAPFRITGRNAQHVNLRNEDGREIGTAGTPLRTDPTGTTTQPISFSGQQPIHGTVQINGPLGGGVEVGAVRVTVASDSTGVLSVDDNGSSLTIDGAVGVNNLPTVGTVVFQSAQAVTFSGAQPISTVAGTITANIRNSIFTHKIARVDLHGAGNHTIIAGQSNKRVKVYGINTQASIRGTVPVAWLDGTAPMAGTQIYVDREGYTMSVSPPAFLLAPQPGTALVAHVGTILNSGGGFRGWVNYWDDDAF